MGAEDKNKEKELGFGKSSGDSNVRFINKDGSINVLRKGLPLIRPYDTYHSLITIGWTKFLGLVACAFFLVNFLFTLVYYFLGSAVISEVTQIKGVQRFWDVFFFSVQTMTTVGYGAMSPISSAAKTISTVESLIGLLGIALMTGVLYGRFSRPQTKIKYSKNVLIAPYQEGKALMFKMANQRSSKLIEAEVTVVFSCTKNGKQVFEKLPLELEKINFFALSWTVVHPIDDDSPLKGFNPEDDAEVVILVKAFDDTFSQTVYSRMSYVSADFVWNAKFESSIKQEDGQMMIDLGKLNNYIKQGK
ncbi:MAG: inward rectifier potassium channel [Glaciecola sp.]|jgi:inward rectifier potassium channel